jgi:hypothetical protein
MIALLSLIVEKVTNISSPFNNEKSASDDPERVRNLIEYGPITTQPANKNPK